MSMDSFMPGTLRNLFLVGCLALFFLHHLRNLDPTDPWSVYKLLTSCFFLLLVGPLLLYTMWANTWAAELFFTSLPVACVCTLILGYRIMKKKI